MSSSSPRSAAKKKRHKKLGHSVLRDEDSQELEVMDDDEGDAEQAVERFILQEVNKLLANTNENVSLFAFQVKTI